MNLENIVPRAGIEPIFFLRIINPTRLRDISTRPTLTSLQASSLPENESRLQQLYNEQKKVHNWNYLNSRQDNDDWEFVSLYCSFTHTQGTAQAAELQQWRHDYFYTSGLARCESALASRLWGQAWFVCFMPQQQYFSYTMVVII